MTARTTGPTTPRRLIVMRHAKAELSASADHDRSLTDQGQLDAIAAGRWLATQGYVPDHAVISTATRAVQTWDGLARGARSSTRARRERGLYTASPSSVLESLRGVPSEAGTVAYVGHNPTAAELAELLDDGDGDPDARRGIHTGYPTAAMAVFDLEALWEDLEPGRARLVDFLVARA